CLLASLFTGAVSGLLYALPGALLSFLGMRLLLPLYARGRLSAMGLSVFGAFLFNGAQLCVGLLSVGGAILAYFPWMGLLSIPAGLLSGLAAALVKKRVPWS
ncbi:MAG: Gx transporter family protein, partial [Clostridia bacterium]|nr:Gx transporter family protein [Clostridia bacterium]